MRALVVEDEVLVAVEIEFLLEDVGATPVGIAIDRAEALALIARERPELVLLDLHLADGPTGIEIAREAIAASGVAVLFMTANRTRLPDDFAGAVGAVAKPYTEWGMRNALAYVVARLGGEAATGTPPASLELARPWAERWGAAAPERAG